MAQNTLFDAASDWSDDDHAQQQQVAVVVFPEGPEGRFSYLAPPAIWDQLQPVCRVRAPLGRGDRPVVGYCIGIESQPTHGRRLKQLLAVLDQQPLLSPAMLKLVQWMSEHYLCSFGQVLETVLPMGVRRQAGTRMQTVVRLSRQAEEGADLVKLSRKQAEILEYLRTAGSMTTAALAAAMDCTQAPIKALRDKGLIVAESRRFRTPTKEEAPEPAEQRLHLNPDQAQALAAMHELIDGNRYGTVLLHGVTGSGKTEVYIQAIERVLRMGRQAIVLVPEISLTPQTKQRFRARFGKVALLHSHLSDSERASWWEQIACGEVSVVVGARSAVFAPTPNLGLIVLDEEHESSFKQNTAPRYHARDVAMFRAQSENAPLVLGSATPSLESWQRARDGDFRLVDMPRRVLGRPMPHVATIDLRQEFESRRERGALSRPLRLAMERTLGDGGQVILLLNRRGFSTHIQCPSCGEVVRCPSCELALTHHREGEAAICHYCDYSIPTPTACPECRFTGIHFSGIGTQRLEMEVQGRFPNFACLRMDADSMQKPGSHEKALSAFRRGDVQILLGTQMIAKGLDFPNVMLVGVINADLALHLPDFRAAERTFQLIVQVAGRTGRGERGGRVLVQTFSPDHPAIRAAVQHDFGLFAKEELATREMLTYPPFASMIRIVAKGPHADPAQIFARLIADRVREQLAGEEGFRVLGPAPCPLPKLRGMYRYQIQVQGREGDRLRAAVQAVTGGLELTEDIQWMVDVDPIDML